jgi:hypothetical protein
VWSLIRGKFAKSIDVIISLSSSEVAHSSRADHSSCSRIMFGIRAGVYHEFGHSYILVEGIRACEIIEDRLCVNLYAERLFEAECEAGS